MALSFPYVWGSGGGSGGYVEDGLIAYCENTANLWQVAGFRETGLALTDLTAEICCTITGINVGTMTGRILAIRPLYIGVLSDPQYVEPGFDYSFQAFIINVAGFEAIIGLNFGDMHTFAVTRANSVFKVYLDGTYIGEFTAADTLTWNYLDIMRDDNSARTPYGTWNHARIYNTALTAEQLTANHAEDVRRYG